MIDAIEPGIRVGPLDYRVEPVIRVAPVSVYYENRISDDKKFEHTMSITKEPHIVYDSNGNLVEIPDRSFNLGSKFV